MLKYPLQATVADIFLYFGKTFDSKPIDIRNEKKYNKPIMRKTENGGMKKWQK